MSNLATIVRKLTGRQLTDDQIGKAKRDAWENSKKKRVNYNIKDDNIIIETFHSDRTMLDASEGFYFTFKTVKKYTLDGLLKEEHVFEGDYKVSTPNKSTFYNPPGRLIGKTEK